MKTIISRPGVALLLLGVLLLAGCRLDLDEFPRAFACDRDGADGGQQCAAGWSCGYDQKCFRRQLRPGTTGVEAWQCTNDDQCPTAWRCGQAVDDKRLCQALDAGAPSPCTDDEGCQGGWRCGADQHCFDPSDVDGGTTRTCTADSMCPNGLRCGQEVPDRERFCLQLDAGAPVSCLDDLGCEGGWRCDRYNARCVLVTDALTTSRTAALAVTRISPRFVEPAPSQFAMTPLSSVPRSLDVPDAGYGSGVLWASVLSDGGLRVTVQLRDSTRRADAGVELLQDRTFPLPANAAPSAVTDLAVASGAAGVRLQDGRAFTLQLGGGNASWVNAWPDGGTTTFLRQRDPGFDGDRGAIVVVSGREVRSELLWNTLPAPISEVTMIASNDGFAFTPQGVFGLSLGGIVPNAEMGQPRFASTSRGLAFGVLTNPMGDPFEVTVAEVQLDGGAVGFTSGVRLSSQGIRSWMELPPSPACPDGSSPQQMTVTREDARPALLARCKAPDGTPYPVAIPLLSTTARYRSTVEDGTPFVGEVVSQKTGPFVRAHASTNGRVWHAVEPAPNSLYDEVKGIWPLRPVVLDRQPLALVSFFDGQANAARVFASTGDRTFAHDVNGGLISELRVENSTPLGPVQGSAEVLVASTGLIFTQGAQSRFVALVTGADRLEPPASGALATLAIDGAPRTIVLVVSGDSVWSADITEAQASAFAQPATLTRVLVPVPGVRLRSIALEPSTSGLSGYVTTNSKNLRFSTSDLVRWALSDVPTPPTTALPLAVWSELDGGAARTGFGDGRVWSLPVMVELSEKLTARDGGSLSADDYARKCGDLFAATREGVFRVEPSDGGLPRWVPLTTVNAALDSFTSLRLFETHDVTDRLFVGTKSGLVIEVTGACR